MRTIEIDFDVHKVIENERRGFDESPNDALRRLLKLPELTASRKASRPAPSNHRSWIDKGVVLPHGTELRMEYRGHNYVGQILNGEWVIDNKQFDSPSGAASGVAITKKGKQTKLDGWKYWYVRRPAEDNWIALNNLRQKPVVLDADSLNDEDFTN
jgi:hypothetical protein